MVTSEPMQKHINILITSPPSPSTPNSFWRQAVVSTYRPMQVYLK